ncbi:MAG: hypothetical protein M1821_007381 [Bathelium mastoideum]|nr:MAG: hypothetical protein M1821_007381 [Bathelium mastoideum]
MAGLTQTVQFDLTETGLSQNRWLGLQGYIDAWRHPDDDDATRYTSEFWKPPRGKKEFSTSPPRVYGPDFYNSYQNKIIGLFTPASISSHNSKAFTQNPMKADRQIRLLHLRPSSDGANVRCESQAYDFPPPISYEALSYCWGPNNKREAITVNGIKTFEVTDNLAAALRRLRLSRTNRVLWIDAICIDQNSVQEKNTQVRLMGEIYGRAQRTLVWLGDSIEEKATSTVGLAQNPLSRALSWIGYGSEVHELPEIDGTQDLQSALLNEPSCWWERLWTVQEVVRSTDLPDICFGPHTFRWHDFRSLLGPIANQANTKVMASPEYDIDVRAPNTRTNTLYIKALKLSDRLVNLERLRETSSRRRSASLLDLARLNLGSAVTDPRDRVYSLLGLVHLQEAEMNKIEYEESFSAQQVFAKATFSIIKRNGNLNVLECVSASTSRDSALPTWAFDFATPTISWVNMAGSRLDPEYLQNPKRKNQEETHLSADHKMLTVKGTIYDAVCAVYPLGPRQDSPLFDAPGSTWLLEVRRRSNGSQYWAGFEAGRVNFIWQYGPSFLRPMSATTMLEGHRSDMCSTTDGELDRIFDNWLRFSAGLKMPMHHPPEYVVSAYWWNHLRRGRIRSYDAVGVHPSFYVTVKGLIGIGPPDTQVDDMVVGLNGAPSLSLIRILDLDRERFAFKGFTYMSNEKNRMWFRREEWPPSPEPSETTLNIV